MRNQSVYLIPWIFKITLTGWNENMEPCSFFSTKAVLWECNIWRFEKWIGTLTHAWSRAQILKFVLSTLVLPRETNPSTSSPVSVVKLLNLTLEKQPVRSADCF